MGTYYKLHFKATLKADTPQEVVDIFNSLINTEDWGIEPKIDHPLFKCERWRSCIGGRWICEPNIISFFKQVGKGLWQLEINSEQKNRDDEIDKLVNFLTPYITGRKKKKWLGYHTNDGDYPSAHQQIHLYINQQENESV